MTHTLALVNYKGGVGKSSIAGSVGAVAAARGRRVLLVDFDLQGNLTSDLGVDGDGGQSMYDALVGTAEHPTVVTARPGLDVVPGGRVLIDVERAMVQAGERQAAEVFRYLLGSVVAGYDLAIVDCPVAFMMIRSVLATVDAVLIPTKHDDRSIDGLAQVARDCVTARDVNEALEVMGVVLFDMRSSDRRIRRETRAQLEARLPAAVRVLDAVVRSAPRAAQDTRKSALTVVEYASEARAQPRFWDLPRSSRGKAQLSRAADGLLGDFETLTDEVWAWFAAREPVGV